MKATEQHINRSRQARQSSYHYRISKAVAKVAKVILIVIGAIVGLTIGWLIKRIFRGIGWIISILSALGIIYWIMNTLSNIYDYGKQHYERNTIVPRHNQGIS